MSFSLQHPQFLVGRELQDKQLDYRALNEVWRATADPCMAIAKDRFDCKRNANEAILSTDNVITVTSKDFPHDNFCYTTRDDDDENEIISFADNSAKREYADRHPGSGAAAIDRSNIDQKYMHTVAHTPITTTASKYLFSVAFAGGQVSNNGHVEIKAAYTHQMSLRIEKESRTLNLDCFEYKPTSLDINRGGEGPPPTYGEMNAYQNLMFYQFGRGSEDEDDDEVVEAADSPEDCFMQHYKALAGKFLNSRVFRLRIDLSNVKGIRLMAMPTDGRMPTHAPIEGDNDISAVLILETNDSLWGGGFAVRTVRSKRNNADEFTQCPDWLPGDHTGLKATRFYFYGSLKELKHTAGYIAKLCPNLARMLEAKESNSLALAPGVVSVDYNAAPSHNVGKQNVNDVAYGDYPLPPLSTWDGTIEGARVAFEKLLAREENPMKRMMLRGITDPESLITINNDPNSSLEDRMLSNLVAQQFIANQGTDGMLDQIENARENGEECVIS